MYEIFSGAARRKTICHALPLVSLPRRSEVSRQTNSPILPPCYTFPHHTEWFCAKGDLLKEQMLEPCSLTADCPPPRLCFRADKAVSTGKCFLLLPILLCGFPWRLLLAVYSYSPAHCFACNKVFQLLFTAHFSVCISLFYPKVK